MQHWRPYLPGFPGGTPSIPSPLTDPCDSALNNAKAYIADLKKSGNPDDAYSIALFEHFLKNKGDPFHASKKFAKQIENSNEFIEWIDKTLKAKISEICKNQKTGTIVNLTIVDGFRVEYTKGKNEPLWRAIGGGSIDFKIPLKIKCGCSAEGCGKFTMYDGYTFGPAGILWYRLFHFGYRNFRFLEKNCSYKRFHSQADGDFCYPPKASK